MGIRIGCFLIIGQRASPVGQTRNLREQVKRQALTRFIQ